VWLDRVSVTIGPVPSKPPRLGRDNDAAGMAAHGCIIHKRWAATAGR
jgi:hypothetical protein